MELTDLFLPRPCAAEVPVVRVLPDGTRCSEQRSILAEHLLEVYLNEVLTLKMVCTATDLAALVVGHLFSEGRIAGIDDLQSLYLCRDGARARVFSEKPLPATRQPIEIRACDCGENGILGRAALESDECPVEPLPDFVWQSEWIFALAQAFADGAPLYQATHGIHSCFLMYDGQIRYLCEDIGRHNALDKALGKALLDHLDLSRCVLFSSGRIPVDMMEKVIRARVPVLASNAVPTDRAVALARRYHVTLICAAKPGGMNVFSCRELWD